jgi:hypothetical protein
MLSLLSETCINRFELKEKRLVSYSVGYLLDFMFFYVAQSTIK